MNVSLQTCKKWQRCQYCLQKFVGFAECLNLKYRQIKVEPIGFYSFCSKIGGIFSQLRKSNIKIYFYFYILCFLAIIMRTRYFVMLCRNSSICMFLRILVIQEKAFCGSLKAFSRFEALFILTSVKTRFIPRCMCHLTHCPFPDLCKFCSCGIWP